MGPRKKGDDPFQKLVEDVEIPRGYTVKRSGVYEKDNSGKEYKISSLPLVAKAYTRDQNSDNWKVLLAWTTLDEEIREEAFNKSHLKMDGKQVIREILDKGYEIEGNKIKEFQDYLNELKPTKRMRQVDKLGWYDNSADLHSFVLPENVIGDSPDEKIYFKPESYASTIESMKQKGSLEEWQVSVAEKTKKNPILIFCLSAAFAGPLLKLLGAESGGFHIYGKSSHGKTTAMQVAASVWGNGEAPTNSSSPAFMQTWTATSNALEGMAAAHNDNLMILDELGQCDATDFKKIVYDLAGGKGKVRMTQNATIVTPKTWRNIYLSTGELSAKSRMETDQQKAKAGQLLRLMDIPTDDGIIQDPHGSDPAKFADALKESCGKNYGWAGPAFLEALLNELTKDPDTDFQQLEENYREYKDNLQQDVLEPEQRRALAKLALVNLAGELACELGILPLHEVDDIRESIEYVKKIWLKANTSLSDSARAVRYIRDYIASNKDKFAEWAEAWADKHSSSGYSYTKNGITLYMFHPPVFEEVCKGVPIKNVCHELIKRNLFSQNDKPKLVSRHKKGPERQSFYVVSSRILSYDFGDE